MKVRKVKKNAQGSATGAEGGGDQDPEKKEGASGLMHHSLENCCCMINLARVVV